MTKAAVTKAINKLNSNLEDTHGKCSLGAKRFFCLPVRVARALDLAIYLETKNTDTWSKKIIFLEEMTETEYINYLKIS